MRTLTALMFAGTFILPAIAGDNQPTLMLEAEKSRW